VVWYLWFWLFRFIPQNTVSHTDVPTQNYCEQAKAIDIPDCNLVKSHNFIIVAHKLEKLTVQHCSEMLTFSGKVHLFHGTL